MKISRILERTVRVLLRWRWDLEGREGMVLVEGRNGRGEEMEEEEERESLGRREEQEEAMSGRVCVFGK